MADAPKRKVTLARVYVWELPVRLTHWVLFFSILVLVGNWLLYRASSSSASRATAKVHFVMGTVRTIHLYAAIVFTLAVLVRIYWLFAGNRYARLTEFIPLSRRRWQSLWRTFLYYSFITARTRRLRRP